MPLKTPSLVCEILKVLMENDLVDGYYMAYKPNYTSIN